MGRQTTVTCDSCGADLSNSNDLAYRLSLKAETIPVYGNVVTAIWLEPPIERELIFCDLLCLRQHPLVQNEADLGFPKLFRSSS